MKTHRVQRWLAYLVIGFCSCDMLSAAESNPSPPAITNISCPEWAAPCLVDPYPAAQEFKILGASNFTSGFRENTFGLHLGL